MAYKLDVREHGKGLSAEEIVERLEGTIKPLRVSPPRLRYDFEIRVTEVTEEIDA